MTTPKLDEDVIVATLKTAPTLESLRTLQTGAFMLVIDAYDRKVRRDAMITAVSAATELLAELGKLFMIEQMRIAAGSDGVSLVQIEEAYQGLVKNIEKTSRDAVAMAELLKQCPNDEDRIQ